MANPCYARKVGADRYPPPGSLCKWIHKLIPTSLSKWVSIDPPQDQCRSTPDPQVNPNFTFKVSVDWPPRISVDPPRIRKLIPTSLSKWPNFTFKVSVNWPPPPGSVSIHPRIHKLIPTSLSRWVSIDPPRISVDPAPPDPQGNPNFTFTIPICFQKI